MELSLLTEGNPTMTRPKCLLLPFEKKRLGGVGYYVMHILTINTTCFYSTNMPGIHFR